jgi:hypothetical protein
VVYIDVLRHSQQEEMTIINLIFFNYNPVCERISGNFLPTGDYSLPGFFFIVVKKADVISGLIFNIKRLGRIVFQNKVISIDFISYKS